MIPPHAPPTQTFHITVVDDDLSVRHALDRLIRSLGHAAATYATVSEFLLSPSFKETHCLILDIQMPGLSGLDLQNILHALGAPVPIIFVTGYHDEEVRARALTLGAFGFLEKPFDDQALIDLIQKIATSPT